MTDNSTHNGTVNEEEILEALNQGLQEAVEAKGFSWDRGTKVKRQKYTDIALTHFIGPIIVDGKRNTPSPITRSWFKYGSLSDRAPSGPNMTGPGGPTGPTGPTNEGQPFDGESPEIEADPIALPDTDDKVNYSWCDSEIARSSETDFLQFFLDEELVPPLTSLYWEEVGNYEFLERYYEVHAPPMLQDLYLANVALRKAVEEAQELTQEVLSNRGSILAGDSDLEQKWENSELEQQAGRVAVELRLALRSCDIIPEEVVSTVHQFTDLIEDVLLRIENQDPTDVQLGHPDVLNRLDEFYDETVWTYVAFHILKATAIGPGAEQLQDAAKASIASLEETCRDDIAELRREFNRDGLLPSANEYVGKSVSNPERQLSNTLTEALYSARHEDEFVEEDYDE